MIITQTHTLLPTLPFSSRLEVGVPPRRKISKEKVLKDGSRERNLACAAHSVDASMQV